MGANHTVFRASSVKKKNNNKEARFVRGRLLPWPCNMWHLVPKRSRRRRSGHRQTFQVAAVPILSGRLPGALSTRSSDVSQMKNPAFMMEGGGGG